MCIFRIVPAEKLVEPMFGIRELFFGNDDPRPPKPKRADRDKQRILGFEPFVQIRNSLDDKIFARFHVVDFNRFRGWGGQ